MATTPNSQTPLTTIDHDTIRQWAERREGVPASVVGTAGNDPAGVLRFDFPGVASADELEQISWEEWFDKFESENLAFVYQDEEISGDSDTSFQFILR